MCEMLSLRTRHGAFKLGFALSLAERLEAYGDAGYGWGVAWIEPGSPAVRLYKAPRSMERDDRVYAELGDRWASTCMVHLRMPSDFTTIGTPDTQPFLGTLGMAFAHNGYLNNHEEQRRKYPGLLRGRADSEVGMLVFQDALVDTMDTKTGNYDVPEALRKAHRVMGGWRANFNCLFPGGWHYAYASHTGNYMYSLKWMGMEAIVTGMHRRDSKLVRMLFPGAREVSRIADEDVVVWPADRTKPARLAQALKNKAATARAKATAAAQTAKTDTGEQLSSELQGAIDAASQSLEESTAIALPDPAAL